MKRGRLRQVVGALYPRAWRRRYGEELADLCDEYLQEGESNPLRLALGLTVSALGERTRAVGSRRWRPLLASGIALMAVATAALATDTFGLSAGRRTVPAHAVSATNLPLSGTAGVISVFCNGGAFDAGETVTVLAPTPGQVVLPKPGQPVTFGAQGCTVLVRAPG